MSDRIRRYFYSLMTDEPPARGPLSFLLKCILALLSAEYLCLETGIRLLYKYGLLKSYRPGCKVMSVGNITLGGTGKTPLVIAIARHLRDSGKKVAILSRGYKGEKGSDTSDEIELFKKYLPDVPVFALSKTHTSPGLPQLQTARRPSEKASRPPAKTSLPAGWISVKV